MHLSPPLSTTRGLLDAGVALFSPLARFFIELLTILTFDRFVVSLP
jgi:hypothetical protein